MKESEIKKQILDALNRCKNTFAFPIYSTGLPIGTTGKFRKNHHKGVADIIVCKGDKFMAIEVKTGNKKAEPHQYEWLKKIANVGGHASVVHSVEEAMESWEEV